MEFQLKPGEKVKWKAETDGKIWSVWPVIDDGNPGSDDRLTDRTFEYRKSLGIRRVNARTNRFDVTRDSKDAIDVWFKARGIPLTFDAIARS